MNFIKSDLPERIVGVHLWRAWIAETATALDQQVKVNIPDFDPVLLWGPCKWAPRVIAQTVNVAESGETAHNVVIPQIVMPTMGDYALVILDNVSEAWIAVWWPAAYGGINTYAVEV